MSGAHAHAGGDEWPNELAVRASRLGRYIRIIIRTYTYIGRTFSSAALQRLLWYG